MRPGRQVHRLVIGLHALRDGHWRERRLGSARVSRAGDCVPQSRTFGRLFWRDAKTSTRDACATQKIIVPRLFHVPHRVASVRGEAVQRPDQSERAQLLFWYAHATFEIIEGNEWREV